MEQSLGLVKDQLSSEEVQMVFQILKQSNKFRIVMQFNADADIDPKLKIAREYNKLLKDIPVKSLLEADTIESIATTIKKIFVALKRVRQIGSYPLPRAIELGQCIAIDFGEQLKKVLSASPLMIIEYKDYMGLQKELNLLEQAWAEAIKDFKAGIGNKLQGSLGGA